jgi:hypothetical protein
MSSTKGQEKDVCIMERNAVREHVDKKKQLEQRRDEEETGKEKGGEKVRQEEKQELKDVNVRRKSKGIIEGRRGGRGNRHM